MLATKATVGLILALPLMVGSYSVLSYKDPGKEAEELRLKLSWMMADEAELKSRIERAPAAIRTSLKREQTTLRQEMHDISEHIQVIEQQLADKTIR